LFTLLRDWIAEDRAQWDVIRRKLRFVGVTVRHKTSPNTFRWQQHASWTRLLPARAVVNVSLEGSAWAYLADRQVKLTRSLPLTGGWPTLPAPITANPPARPWPRPSRSSPTGAAQSAAPNSPGR
jgi:hypothetical protein